jgi:glycosyltransferase involved in cell wall biosynthesis
MAATIVARNYLAHARVLAATFLAQHPKAQFAVLIIDGDDEDRHPCEAFKVVLPADLDLPPGDWEQMAGVYSVLELATAIKPAWLRHLLDAGAGQGEPKAVLYLDPDIVIYGPFPEVFSVAERSGVALTPHVLHPLPRDGLEPDEGTLMHSGLFNLGFICVGQSGRRFLDWWHERLRLDAVIDLPNALFTDQRWVDWVPSLFGGEVLRDHGLNVAYWNLHERPLSRGSDGAVLAGGDPLKFFHFSGYEPEQPCQLSKHAALRPRCRLLDQPVVAELCNSYAESLAAAGLVEEREKSFRFGAAANGLCLTATARAAYRAGVKDAQREGSPPPASPFAADGGAAFTDWLMAPTIGPPGLQLGRWHLQLWRARPDLQVAFPDPGGSDAQRYRDWLDVDAGARKIQDDLALPARYRRVGDPPSEQPRRPFASPSSGRWYGWNIVGYFSAELGVGEAARRMNAAVEGAGIPTQLVSVSADGSRQRHQVRRTLSADLHYRDSLFCVNANEIERVLALTEGSAVHLDRSTDRGRRIGLWFWEVDRFPSVWAGACDLFDEIWCSSRFTADSIGALARVPVRVVPLPVWAPSGPTPFSRRQLGLPEGFVFLFCYDFHSVFERKNPLGLLEAYIRAFRPSEGTTLVLKSINGAQHPAQLDQLRRAVQGRHDVVIIDGYLDAHRVQAMIEHCDCFVSLHRSEGFGLNLAAAMGAGRPVIATGYSGNLTFMDSESAFLVPYELVEVGAGNHPYPTFAHWAAPDLDVAASMMRQVVDDPEAAGRVAERGRSRVFSSQRLDRASAVVASLLLGSDPVSAGSAT